MGAGGAGVAGASVGAALGGGAGAGAGVGAGPQSQLPKPVPSLRQICPPWQAPGPTQARVSPSVHTREALGAGAGVNDEATGAAPLSDSSGSLPSVVHFR